MYLWRLSRPRRAGEPLGPAPSLSIFSGDRNSFLNAAATFSLDLDVMLHCFIDKPLNFSL